MTTPHDHGDDHPTDEDLELIALHADLDLHPDGEAVRLAEAAEPWEPPDA